MHQLFIGIGSNLQPEKQIRAAHRQLRQLFCIRLTSPVYRSRPVGVKHPVPDFYNLVVHAETEVSAHEVVHSLKAIEQDLGRRPEHDGRHPIDLDLLAYDDLVCDDDTVSVPNPDIESRAFVLRPLADIAPDHCHPITNLPYRTMWQRFTDDAQVLSLVDDFEFSVNAESG